MLAIYINAASYCDVNFVVLFPPAHGSLFELNLCHCVFL